LELLERRSHRDSDAQHLERRIEQAAQGRLDAGSLWKQADAAGLLAKYTAVHLLRELRLRCPAEKRL
jgi:hypothetical protein